MFSTSCNVKSCKIHAKFLSWFLEQMVCNLLGDGGVKCLSNLEIFLVINFTKSQNFILFSNKKRVLFYLVYKSHHVGIRPSRLVQIVRLLQHLGKLLRTNISESKWVTIFYESMSISNNCITRGKKNVYFVSFLPVCLRPPLYGRRKESMSKTECSWHERSSSRRVGGTK